MSSNDEDMLAQIANIEAQLSFQQANNNQQQQQQQQTSWQPSGPTFGGQPQGSQAQAAQGFPRSQNYGGQQPAGTGAPGQVSAPQQPGHQFSKDSDDRSVFVGNLPKGGASGITTTPEEVAAFFQDCGPILTCTLLKDKATGELKGTAYVEFATYEAGGRAIDTKNNANFKGCTITVSKKRSLYRAGMGRGGAPGGAPRGRGGRGGGMFQPDPMQAMMALMAMSAAGMQQFMGGRGRGGRGGGRGGHRGGGGGGQDGGGFQPFQ